ncbi:hypothetical protein Nepgr_000011 [Nepenthes gracilis]|uniref:Uncharacterized protein n=1 Tax=Nepenthes gracilis TaxID=150966 RepID=A0AAD3RV86_NEPGR|nr:hypothetical protein Nepgr_000011 [Nepenthes gracilis]
MQYGMTHAVLGITNELHHMIMVQNVDRAANSSVTEVVPSNGGDDHRTYEIPQPRIYLDALESSILISRHYGRHHAYAHLQQGERITLRLFSISCIHDNRKQGKLQMKASSGHSSVGFAAICSDLSTCSVKGTKVPHLQYRIAKSVKKDVALVLSEVTWKSVEPPVKSCWSESTRPLLYTT